MKVQVTISEAGWLKAAATYLQDGRTFEDAMEMLELSERISREADLPENWKIGASEAMDRQIELSIEEAQMLHAQLKDGRRWTYSAWPRPVMAIFGGLIARLETEIKEEQERIAEQIKREQARKRFEAMSESDKHRALAQAKKEQT